MHIPRKLIKSDRRKIIDILDKFQFFQGQRAGRELWLNKPIEVQEEDLENFNKDIRTIRDYICDLETSVKKYKDLEEQGLLREVKKGKWIRVNVQKSWGKSTKIVCSICEKKSWLNYDFCPNCGADMREEYQNAND